RGLAGGRRASVDGAVLADHGRAADLDPRVLALVLQVLRVVADNGAIPDLHAPPEPHVALQHRVRGDVTALADRHVRADDRVRAHGRVVRQLCRRIDQRGPVDHFSVTIAIISASATTCPSTYPTPFILHVLPRNWTISSSKRIWSPGTTGRRNFTLSSDMK